MMDDDEDAPATKKLELLKGDVDEIFDAFEGILAVDEASRRVKRPSLQEKEQLALLRQQLRQPVTRSLSEQASSVASATCHIPPPKRMGSMSGTNAADMVQRITDQLENISAELVQKVEESSSRNREADSRNAELQVAAENHKAQFERLQSRLQTLCEEMAVAKTNCQVLRKQVDEKNEKILRLNRQNTVQLWEREKKRVLKESSEREESLMSELQSMRDRVRDMKDRAVARFRKMNEDLKREKMRADLRLRETLDKDDPLLVAENIQRQLYVTEKKLANACEEIKLQQKLTVGVIGGLRRDFSIVKARWTCGEPSSSGDNFALMMDTLYDAASAGTLDSLRADLDLHYQALDSDIVSFPKKIATLSSRKPLESDQRKESGGGAVKLKPLKTDSKEPKKSDSTPISPSFLRQSKLVRRLSATGSRKPPTLDTSQPPKMSPQSTTLSLGDVIDEDSVIQHRASPDSGQGTSSRAVSRRTSRADSGHPALINTTTGLPNIREAVNLFPELNDAQVRVHFSRFMTYDKNRDFTLDRGEVQNALSEIRDSSIKDEEFSAAFAEIDIDGSGSLDFYEYLVLHRRLSSSTAQGNSFTETQRLTNRGQISKACVVQ